MALGGNPARAGHLGGNDVERVVPGAVEVQIEWTLVKNRVVDEVGRSIAGGEVRDLGAAISW